MSYLILIISLPSSISLILLFVGLIIFISLLIGKIAPKLGLSIIFLISLLNFLFQKQATEIAEPPSKQPFIAVDTQTIVTTPSITKPIKKNKIKPKYITKVQLEGVSNDLLLQKFEEKSGYTIAEKWDYLITFSYSGSIKKGNKSDGSRFVYSGGHLVVNVGSNQCCCNGLVPLPKNIPLGKSMKEGLEIMSQKVEEYALANIDIITPMIVECLPKY